MRSAMVPGYATVWRRPGACDGLVLATGAENVIVASSATSKPIPGTLWTSARRTPVKPPDKHLRYHLTTFGCQMNEHDSERMRGMLEALGYAEAPERAEADLILFNTCSIRESADSRFVAHLGQAKRLKREWPERIVGVGGCWAQS